MKRLISLIALSCAISGCATPLVIDNGKQTRVFTPCTNDNLCFRDTYNVLWDNWCPNSPADYPISYRSKQTEYESNKVEYILLPNTVYEREVRGER